MRLRDIYGPEVADAVLALNRSVNGNFFVNPDRTWESACIVGACNAVAANRAGYENRVELYPDVMDADNDATAGLGRGLKTMEFVHVRTVIDEWDEDVPDLTTHRAQITTRELAG